MSKYEYDCRNPVDKHSWKTHGGAAVVNAFYSSSGKAKLNHINTDKDIYIFMQIFSVDIEFLTIG
jgi:hypothetical protein